MYDINLKSKRIKAQVKAMGGLGFPFNNYTKHLDTFVDNEEDLYGYLLGYNSNEQRWEVILVTSEYIYILDKDNHFTKSYSDYPLKAYKGSSVESNIFNTFKVVVTLGREKYYYKDCKEVTFNFFKAAVKSAQKGGELPYAFDRTPFEVKEKKSRNIDMDYSDDFYDSYMEETPKHIDIYQDGESTGSIRNVYLHPLHEGEGFMPSGDLDSKFKEQSDYFEKITGKRPMRSDFKYLFVNKRYINKFIDNKELPSFIAFGRKGKLYLFKEEHDCILFPEDYPSIEEYERALSLKNDIENADKQENLLQHNHVANRFVDKPIKDDNVSFDFGEQSQENDNSSTVEENNNVTFTFDIDEILSEKENSFDEPDFTETPVESFKFDTVKSAHKSAISDIKAYKELLDEGILTEEEFNAKKKEILGL